MLEVSDDSGNKITLTMDSSNSGRVWTTRMSRSKKLQDYLDARAFGRKITRGYVDKPAQTGLVRLLEIAELPRAT
jgi:hypothetical protein